MEPKVVRGLPVVCRRFRLEMDQLAKNSTWNPNVPGPWFVSRCPDAPPIVHLVPYYSSTTSRENFVNFFKLAMHQKTLLYTTNRDSARHRRTMFPILPVLS